ncbi:MAG: hypothetical protein PHH28_11355, partial [Desulfuromonadaceae bacterium]|nr:hypothetical protein [Desulfuromonadaceae bacterium]
MIVSGVRCLLMTLLCSAVLVACNSPETSHTPVIARVPSSALPVTGDALVEGTIGEASTLIP